jgi:hypothetical protein
MEEIKAIGANSIAVLTVSEVINGDFFKEELFCGGQGEGANIHVGPRSRKTGRFSATRIK